jgi:hypothetical protein
MVTGSRSKIADLIVALFDVREQKMNTDERDGLESEAKRRRLRKGTHSCWACKRRKARCSFALLETDGIETGTPTGTPTGTCLNCRRRGTKCISQELPEDRSVNQAEDSTDRIVRVEALLNQLVNKGNPVQSTSEDGRRPHPHAAPTPVTDSSPNGDSEPSSFLLLNDDADINTPQSMPAFCTPDSQTPTTSGRAAAAHLDTGKNKYEKISRALVAALPSQEDMDILHQAGNKVKTFGCQVGLKVRSPLDREDLQDEFKLSEMRSPHIHPVLLAKQMLLFSLTLLHLSPNESLQGLSEHSHVVMERLADTVINLVTTCEELLGTMDSLECILLEAYYHLDNGNIRRAWLAFRRAMGAAQLMGIHRPIDFPVKVLEPSSANIDPPVMWFRIVYMDRLLSLLLGLPQGNSDTNLCSDTPLAHGTPSEKFEVLHSGILAKIFQRNEISPSPRAIEMTREIDKQLLEAADGLPSNFWRPPNFTGLEQNSPEAFWEGVRVRDQMVHYTLLNQLHLPFMLCPGADCMPEYAKITCVNSSREILTRFVAFRTFNRIPAYCRLADYLALVAGMTLILAHIYNHRSNQEGANVLAHQRLGDRATVEQTLDNMEVSSRLRGDMLGAKCVELLQHLLLVEADAAKGHSYSAQHVPGVQGVQSNQEDECTVLFITIPYIGTIKITREGISSMDKPITKPITSMSPSQTRDLEGNITIGGIGSVSMTKHSNQSSTNVPQAGLVDHVNFDSLSSPSGQGPTQAQFGELHTVSNTEMLPNAVVGDDFMQQQDLYPSVAAGMNDWVFQGVDTAFFDSLMKSTSVHVGDGSGSADWTQTWHSDLERL